MGSVEAIHISRKKKTAHEEIDEEMFTKGYGLERDAYSVEGATAWFSAQC